MLYTSRTFVINKTFLTFRYVPPPVENIMGEECDVVMIEIYDDEEQNLYSNLVKTMKKYKVEESQIVWCPYTPMQARVQLSSQSSKYIDRLIHV